MLAPLTFVTLGLVAPPVLGPSPTQEPSAEPSAEPARLLVRGEKLYLRPGRVLENGALLIENGRVVAVGRDLEAPEGTRVLTGKVVCPGFIDAWSSFALDSNAFNDDRIDAGSQAADAVDGFVDARLERAILAAGVTAYRMQATDTGRAAGIGAVLRLHPERRADETTVLADCCVAFGLGIPRGSRGMDVFERVSDVDRVVGEISDGLSYLQDTNEYRHELEDWNKAIADKEKELEDGFKKAKKDREKAESEAKEKGTEFKEKSYKEDKKPKPPRFDPEKEVMARVAAGELPLVIEVHRAFEIHNLLEATEKFERLRLILAGATEAAAVADELKRRDVPVIVWPRPNRQGRPGQTEPANLALAAELDAAGVEVILGSGAAADLASRDLPLLAALAVGHGLSPQSALAALTTRPARAFDVADRLGSLELGRDADVVVFDGEPFAATTKVKFVISGGDLVIEGE